ncbi:MAG: NAD(P)-binding protein [Pseudomonadales bacterium]
MRTITRRSFLQGMAVPVATHAMSAMAATGAAPDSRSVSYPPALTGLRGAHVGSFEVAHALAREGARWSRPATRTDAVYDLVVVGAGISGLAAAWLFRQQVGRNARILILDNHDDFGGHAKRNEFAIDGHTLIGYGGSQSLDSPASYSRVARQVVRAVGVDVERFHDYFDTGFQARHHLDQGVLFGADMFAVSRLVRDAVTAPNAGERRKRLKAYPVSPAARTALERLYAGRFIDAPALRERLNAPERLPFEEFLRLAVGMPEDGLRVLRDLARTFWGFGVDALSLREMLDFPVFGPGLPRGVAALSGRLSGAAGAGFDVSGETDLGSGLYPDEPYIFHFPDGNAGLARLLVRSLVPDAMPGRTMEDVVLGRARYDRLDRPEQGARIRLMSTAVDVRNTPAGAEVVYVRAGQAKRVEANHVILACWNNMIPKLCPELSLAQREALEYPEKIPLAVINVGLRNWRAIADSGIGEVYAPGGFLSRLGLDFPVSMGGYRYSANPDQPVVLDCWHAAATRETGTDPRERLRAGRHAMLALGFDDYENAVRAQLTAAWGPHGFDPDRDIAAITVNRWPHGYTWEYTDLWDPPGFSRGAGPHVIARQQIGRISIANSDAEAFAYVNGAIDAAYRAVYEQTAR